MNKMDDNRKRFFYRILCVRYTIRGSIRSINMLTIRTPQYYKGLVIIRKQEVLVAFEFDMGSELS